MLKTKLSYRDQSNHVRYVMKTGQNNNVTNCIGLVYAETDIELLWPL